MNAFNDQEIIKTLAECLDRPAFTTAFRNESNIPDFEKAITDTIEVLNTGMHRLRDGTLIRKISSRHQISNKELKVVFDAITQQVVNLRDKFNLLKKSEQILPCSCGDTNCSSWFLSPSAGKEMDNIRIIIFKHFKCNRQYLNRHLRNNSQNFNLHLSYITIALGLNNDAHSALKLFIGLTIAAFIDS